MKSLNLFCTATVAAALMISSSGCKHKPISSTPIPEPNMPAAPAPAPYNPPANNLPPGNPFPTEAQPNAQPNTSGIPFTENTKYSRLWNGQGKEDRQKFAADTTYFDFDSATIKKSEESKLADVAAYFKSNTTDALTVEGNCDERGTEKYNLSLGDRRALAVREYLAQLGVDPARIHTVTFGASKPVDPGHNEEAWKKNRRGDLVLLQPLQ